MNNKVQTYYVDYNAAKLLRKFGFNVPCEFYYEWYPHFCGEPLGCDEEYELTSEGRKDEITYKELIQRMYNTNDSFSSKKHCSCPSLDIVRDWLLENFNIYISPLPYWDDNNNMVWMCKVFKIRDNKLNLLQTIVYKKTNIKALADGIEYVLDYLNKHKNERKKD